MNIWTETLWIIFLYYTTIFYSFCMNWGNWPVFFCCILYALREKRARMNGMSQDRFEQRGCAWLKTVTRGRQGKDDVRHSGRPVYRKSLCCLVTQVAQRADWLDQKWPRTQSKVSGCPETPPARSALTTRSLLSWEFKWILTVMDGELDCLLTTWSEVIVITEHRWSSTLKQHHVSSSQIDFERTERDVWGQRPQHRLVSAVRY